MANQILKKFIAPDAVDGSKIKLLNNQALRARDAAGSSDLEILKINVSDQVEILQDLSMSSNRIVGVLDPESAQDAATKAYVDNAVAGLSWKQAVHAASTADVDIASAPAAIDGYSMSNGDRVLLKDQTVESENGVYVFNGAASALTRSSDVNSWAELVGAVVYVMNGDDNAGSKWVSTNVDGGALGTDNVSFTMFSAASALDGAGTTGYVSYWSNSHTLTSEQFLAQSRGGFGQDASALGDGLIKKASGSYVSAALVNADVDSAAAIAFSKMASLSADKALVSDGSGVVSASAVTGTELGYLSGVTSGVQAQLNNKASTTLNNLGTTSINAHLLVSGGGQWDLGASGVGFKNLYLGGASGGTAFIKAANAGSNNLKLQGVGLGVAGIIHSDATGVVTSSAIVNADVSATAAIAYSKLALSNSIMNADINSAAAIAYSKLALSDSIMNADVNSAAAISYSKLALSDSIMDADINSAAAISYSKLDLADSIMDADINSAAAIAYSKLALSDSIMDADVNSAAAIAYSKLALAGSIKLDSDVDTSTVLPVAQGGTGLNSFGSANQILRVNSAGTALEYVTDEGTTMNKESFELDAMDISNQYVDLDFEVNPNSIMAFAGRLALHKDEDYSVSVVSGKTRITFANSIASAGDEALVAGDKLFFTYNYTA